MSTQTSNFDPKTITKYYKDQPKTDISSFKSGQKFQDSYFPPNSNSLFSKNSDDTFVDPIEGPALYQQFINDVAFAGTTMTSVTKISQDWEVFKDKIEFADVIQQGLGDCYFLATLASLASYPNLIKEKFRNSFNLAGYYEIVLFIDGRWQVVIVDDTLPMNRNKQFVFAKPNGNELWSSLLEKAWAKVNGGYTNIVGGTSKDPLLALTGFPTVQYVYNGENEDAIYKAILKGSNTESIMCCGTTGEGEAVMTYNMIAGHEYSLLMAKETEDKKISLVKLRNPWGEGNKTTKSEFTGDWSDTSKKWTEEFKCIFWI